MAYLPNTVRDQLSCRIGFYALYDRTIVTAASLFERIGDRS